MSDGIGFSMGKGGQASAVNWGHVAPPPLPSCAIQKAEHLVKGRKDMKRLKHKLALEAFDFHDRHGCGGDIDGFRAFLRHKFGNAARGWRLAIAPHGDAEGHDYARAGTKATLYSDLCRGLKQVGFAGNAVSLWKALSKGASTAWLEDLDPDLADSLDVIAEAVAESYPADAELGGAWRAWKDIKREHMGRATADEFSEFIFNAIPRGTSVRVRQVFECLCISGRGTLTQEEFVFLDHWAHRRLGKPLPQPPVKRVPEEVHWSPPPKKPPHVPDLIDFRKHLEQKCGSPARAWRVSLDLKGANSLTMAEFGMACRQTGWHHPHASLYNELVRAGGGSANLRGLDPETCNAIDTLLEGAIPTFGTIFNTWAEVLDPDGDGICPRAEFVRAVSKEFGLSGRAAGLIFTVLDISHTGWIAIAELGYLESFLPPSDEYEEEEMMGQSSMNSQKSMLTSMSQGALLPGPSSSTLPGRSGRQLDGSWLADSSWTGSSFDGVGSGSASMRMSSTYSTSRPDLGSTQKSSRAQQYRQWSNCHLAKYQWQGHAAAAQTRSMREGSAWAHLKNEVEPNMPTVGGTPLSDVFRFTNEFYREGVKRIHAQHEFEKEKEQAKLRGLGSASQRSAGTQRSAGAASSGELRRQGSQRS